MQVAALIDEEDGRFGVAFPDFPGCTTVANSLDEAVTKAALVLAFHAEGLAEDSALPTPRTLSALRNDAQFRRDAKGAVVAVISYQPPSRVLRINITLDESLLARIDRAAAGLGETRSGFLADAARRRLSESI
jgi:predicted RNase H-like HicB family nuclease